MQMISDDKSNCNVIGGINTSLNSGFGIKNYNPLHNIGCGNNSSSVGLKINVNGVNICNKLYIL